MAQIQLYQPTQGPPKTVGRVKPPFSLADRSGEQQLGQAVAGIGLAVWDDIIKTQATNEVATARGRTNELIESFNTYAVKNPNASPEELEKERQRIVSEIKGLQGSLKTRPGQQQFGNFLAANAGLINQKMMTSVAATKAKQEFVKSEQAIASFKAHFDIPGLKNHYEQMVENNMYDRDTIFGYNDESGKYGLRPDGTQKGLGYYGELKLGGKLKDTDAIATEYSIGTTDVTART